MADAKRVVVLVSGQGSNLKALLDAAAEPGSRMAVVLVAADRPEAYGLERARLAGVDVAVVRPADHPDRPAFDRALRDLVAAARPDAVCLAGFMRILGPDFVRAFPDRIVNTHPSLLPAFRGAHAVRDALAYGVKVSGCTVHLVDEEVDHGPVLFQAAVPVQDDDDEDRLHERIKREEHRLLPAAVRLVAGGLVRVDGRRTRVTDAGEVAG
ncbi:MAG TPA: phosphoribosylglycinamide formyltransferase [Actinomycetes bacterium]|nr:phosphoribosylglycinamide formyltransferase [Actinomycetes bacterium]